MRTSAIAVLVALSLVAVSACVGREVLVWRDSAVPDGVDFSGQWVLRDESNDTIRRLRNAEISAAGGREAIVSNPRRSSRDKTSLVYVFLETGKHLKVTQTELGLFISFDRSIVEEYRFGEHRPVSVGPVSADRSSGFEGDAYVIETLDRDGNRLLDRYEVVDGGDVLLRHITVYRKKLVELSLVQKFERA